MSLIALQLLYNWNSWSILGPKYLQVHVAVKSPFADIVFGYIWTTAQISKLSYIHVYTVHSCINWVITNTHCTCFKKVEHCLPEKLHFNDPSCLFLREVFIDFFNAFKFRKKTMYYHPVTLYHIPNVFRVTNIVTCKAISTEVRQSTSDPHIHDTKWGEKRSVVAWTSGFRFEVLFLKLHVCFGFLKYITFLRIHLTTVISINRWQH